MLLDLSGSSQQINRCDHHQQQHQEYQSKQRPAMSSAYHPAGDDCAINELLEGRMDLDVRMPDGRKVRLTVERRTPMMDLLVQASSTAKISPAGHVIHVFGDGDKNSTPLPYKPSTPIGTLDTNTIYIVPKKEAGDYLARRTGKTANRPFEPTFRVQVHLPRNQLTVLRVSPRVKIAELKSMVCKEKGLDTDRYQLVRPSGPSEPLSGNMTLSEYGSTEITLLSNSSIESNICNSTSHILPYSKRGDEQKRKTGILRLLAEDVQRKHATLNCKQDVAGHQRNASSKSTQEVHIHQQRFKPKKRRPAPPPPPPTLPEAPSHSRQSSSDSSGYHEATSSFLHEEHSSEEKASSDSSGVSSIDVKEPPVQPSSPPAPNSKKKKAPAPPIPKELQKQTALVQEDVKTLSQKRSTNESVVFHHKSRKNPPVQPDVRIHSKLENFVHTVQEQNDVISFHAVIENELSQTRNSDLKTDPVSLIKAETLDVPILKESCNNLQNNYVNDTLTHLETSSIKNDTMTRNRKEQQDPVLKSEDVIENVLNRKDSSRLNGSLTHEQFEVHEKDSVQNSVAQTDTTISKIDAVEKDIIIQKNYAIKDPKLEQANIHLRNIQNEIMAQPISIIEKTPMLEDGFIVPLHSTPQKRPHDSIVLLNNDLNLQDQGIPQSPSNPDKIPPEDHKVVDRIMLDDPVLESQVDSNPLANSDWEFDVQQLNSQKTFSNKYADPTEKREDTTLGLSNATEAVVPATTEVVAPVTDEHKVLERKVSKEKSYSKSEAVSTRVALVALNARIEQDVTQQEIASSIQAAFNSLDCSSQPSLLAIKQRPIEDCSSAKKKPTVTSEPLPHKTVAVTLNSWIEDRGQKDLFDYDYEEKKLDDEHPSKYSTTKINYAKNNSKLNNGPLETEKLNSSPKIVQLDDRLKEPSKYRHSEREALLIDEEPPPRPSSSSSTTNLKRTSSLLNFSDAASTRSNHIPKNTRRTCNLQRSLSDLTAEDKEDFESEQERLQKEYIKLQRQFILWQQQLMNNHAMLREECIVPQYARTLRQSHSLPEGEDYSDESSSPVPPLVSRSLSYEPTKERFSTLPRSTINIPSLEFGTLQINNGTTTLRSSKTKSFFKPPQARVSTKSRQRLPPEIKKEGDVDITDDAKMLTTILPSFESLKLIAENSEDNIHLSMSRIKDTSPSSERNNENKKIPVVHQSTKLNNRNTNVNGNHCLVTNGDHKTDKGRLENISKNTEQFSNSQQPPPPPPMPVNGVSKPITNGISKSAVNGTSKSAIKDNIRNSGQRNGVSSKKMSPSVDPREQLMLEIRKFGGRTALRKISLAS